MISSESWRKDNGDDLEKDVLLDNERYYKYVTLYVLWEKRTQYTECTGGRRSYGCFVYRRKCGAGIAKG